MATNEIRVDDLIVTIEPAGGLPYPMKWNPGRGPGEIGVVLGAGEGRHYLTRDYWYPGVLVKIIGRKEKCEFAPLVILKKLPGLPEEIEATRERETVIVR
jgi:hypothetical protein